MPSSARWRGPCRSHRRRDAEPTGGSPHPITVLRNGTDGRPPLGPVMWDRLTADNYAPHAQPPTAPAMASLTQIALIRREERFDLAPDFGAMAPKSGASSLGVQPHAHLSARPLALLRPPPQHCHRGNPHGAQPRMLNDLRRMCAGPLQAVADAPRAALGMEPVATESGNRNRPSAVPALPHFGEVDAGRRELLQPVRGPSALLRHRRGAHAPRMVGKPARRGARL